VVTLRLRRCLSWFGFTVVALACAHLLSRLPGAGGVEGELRWLLTRAPTSQSRNRAFLLLQEAEMRTPGGRAALLRNLLHDPDRRVRHGALAAAVDAVRAMETVAGRTFVGEDGLEVALRDWWHQADWQERSAGLPHSFTAWVFSRSSEVADPELRWAAVMEATRAGRLTEAERRWLLAATLQRSDPPRSLIDELAFQGPTARELATAVRFLDGLESRLPSIADGRPPLWNWDPERDHLAWSFSELRGALHDPVVEVRWAAARILAVSGDASGLAVLADWLRFHGRYAGVTGVLMEAVYGVGWRELCESRSTTREARQGDGG